MHVHCAHILSSGFPGRAPNISPDPWPHVWAGSLAKQEGKWAKSQEAGAAACHRDHRHASPCVNTTDPDLVHAFLSWSSFLDTLVVSRFASLLFLVPSNILSHRDHQHALPYVNTRDPDLVHAFLSWSSFLLTV